MIAKDVRSLHVVHDVAIATTGDGQALICTWPGMRVEKTLTLPAGETWLIDPTPGGRPLRSCGPDGSITSWELPAGTPGRKLTGYGHRVTTLASLADQRWLSGAEDGEVVLWSDDDRPTHRLPASSSEIFALFAGLPGDRLLALPRRGDLTCWNLADGTAVGAMEQSADLDVFDITPDGRTVVGLKQYNESCRLMIFDVPTLSVRFSVAIEKGFRHMVVHPDGERLLLAVPNDVNDDEVRVLSLADAAPLRSFESFAVESAFSPDGRYWVDIEWPDVRVFDGCTFRLMTTHRLATSWSPVCIAFGPGSRHLVVAQAEQAVQVWDMANLTPRASDWGARPPA